MYLMDRLTSTGSQVVAYNAIFGLDIQPVLEPLRRFAAWLVENGPDQTPFPVDRVFSSEPSAVVGDSRWLRVQVAIKQGENGDSVPLKDYLDRKHHLSADSKKHIRGILNECKHVSMYAATILETVYDNTESFLLGTPPHAPAGLWHMDQIWDTATVFVALSDDTPPPDVFARSSTLTTALKRETNSSKQAYALYSGETARLEQTEHHTSVMLQAVTNSLPYPLLCYLWLY
jgi:hypothetical protein